jgi:glycine cleavage system H lipoate-binding protein
MTAGVVNYKLCDHNYRCESCDFDKAMRGVISDKEKCGCQFHTETATSPFDQMESKNEETINYFLINLLKHCQLHLDRFYHASHFWIKCQGEDTAALGIDKLILQVLSPIDEIIFPELNTHYQRDQLVAIIVKNKHMFPLHTPLPGRVIDINHHYLDEQEKGNSENNLYLFKLQNPDLVKDKIFSGGKIGGFQTIHCKIELLAYYLNMSIKRNVPAIGKTLADGGEMESDLEKILGEDIYKKFLGDLHHL